jgi:hypothetical protein
MLLNELFTAAEIRCWQELFTDDLRKFSLLDFLKLGYIVVPVKMYPIAEKSFTSRLENLEIFLNLSKVVLRDSEEAVLMKGLNVSVKNPQSGVDMVSAVASVVSKCPQTVDM